MNGQILLVAGVVAVGVLHTMVPDHWGPIAILARQRGWTKAETARAAAQAGAGHVVTTLLLGVVVWIIGATAAQRFGAVVDGIASVALIGFGLWIAYGAWREMRDARHDRDHHHPHDHDHHHDGHAHGHAHEQPAWSRDPLYAPLRSESAAERHLHIHRHGAGPAHKHWHDHATASAHAVTADTSTRPPMHEHRHGTSGRMGLLLILGSSPMVEGIPAFFAASRYGIWTISVMAILFAASTILTYVVFSVAAASGIQRLRLRALEEYGEVISGLFMALIGLVFGLLLI